MLEKFLNDKPLYYDEIDYSRMPRVYERIKDKISIPKVIHLIGTNGKGTTGRFLASALYSLGFRVGHYSSPHIIDFNERIWINGQNATITSLNFAHKNLLQILVEDEANSLSYFEYTTLLAMFVFQNLDYIVLEAGLGGEYDATAVFPKILTLVTPIDRDHEAFLGNTIQEIATTKLNSIQNNAIIANQLNQEVYEVAENISKKKSVNIYKIDTFLESEDLQKIEIISKKLSLVEYLKNNLQLSISALKFLEIKYSENDFKNSKLFGRLTPLTDNILLDVGHNILAAKSIYLSLKESKYILIYNSYKDKNYREILTILKPMIKHIEIINIDDNRIEDKNILTEVIESLNMKNSNFSEIKKDEKYLVFGSFKVVEEFLKSYNG